MISNGYKVIGIEENGDVEYDVMSSCPVSPSKPKLNGSEQKLISKEIKEAIRRFLSSNHSSLAAWQGTPTHALDADFVEMLANKRDEQLKAANEKSLDSEASTNCECEEDMFECEDEIADDLTNCSVSDKDDQPDESGESTFYENEFSP